MKILINIAIFIMLAISTCYAQVGNYVFGVGQVPALGAQGFQIFQMYENISPILVGTLPPGLTPDYPGSSVNITETEFFVPVTTAAQIGGVENSVIMYDTTTASFSTPIASPTGFAIVDTYPGPAGQVFGLGVAIDQSTLAFTVDLYDFATSTVTNQVSSNLFNLAVTPNAHNAKFMQNFSEITLTDLTGNLTSSAYKINFTGQQITPIYLNGPFLMNSIDSDINSNIIGFAYSMLLVTPPTIPAPTLVGALADLTAIFNIGSLPANYNYTRFYDGTYKESAAEFWQLRLQTILVPPLTTEILKFNVLSGTYVSSSINALVLDVFDSF